ncbi:unnamed protein product [Amoebophrya sp. A120]|nr:unnamed protein product [Amoebophrya sp. A120]|eukprot:GSA120T00026370001.1
MRELTGEKRLPRDGVEQAGVNEDLGLMQEFADAYPKHLRGSDNDLPEDLAIVVNALTHFYPADGDEVIHWTSYGDAAEPEWFWKGPARGTSRTLPDGETVPHLDRSLIQKFLAAYPKHLWEHARWDSNYTTLENRPQIPFGGWPEPWKNRLRMVQLPFLDRLL